MSKLKIQNFGPITSGFADNDGFMDFRKVTVFIGNQGTGKSTVAKLFSTCSWLEKALFRGWRKVEDMTKGKEFINLCHYLNLKNYFQDGTVIEYKGQVFPFVFRNHKLHISATNDGHAYRVPKIMYVPAERNFLTAVDNPSELKGIPKALSEFWDELNRAQQELTQGLILPIGNAQFEYNKSNKISRIVGKSAHGKAYKLRLSEASSGFQSYIPLFLVSRSLANSILKEGDVSKSELSGEEREMLRAEVDRIVSNNKLSAEVKQTALESISAKFKYEVFLNIVEEPEQNLFPQSQQIILYQLLEFANKAPGNELLLTTHSPYIVNYLTLAIKAQEVMQKISSAENKVVQFKQLEKTVPAASAVAADEAIVYELTEDGQIKKLGTYHGLPSDDNYLNRQLEETNNLFADLLDLEAAL